MTPNELRIGNYILVDGKIEELIGIRKSTVFFADGFQMFIAQGIEPIPLTVEWLVRFGFECRESSTSKEYYYGLNGLTHDWLFSLVWLDRPDLINAPDAPFYRNGRHTLYFVHQLQNLYFALCGEELIIRKEEAK